MALDHVCPPLLGIVLSFLIAASSHRLQSELVEDIIAIDGSAEVANGSVSPPMPFTRLRRVVSQKAHGFGGVVEGWFCFNYAISMGYKAVSVSESSMYMVKCGYSSEQINCRFVHSKIWTIAKALSLFVTGSLQLTAEFTHRAASDLNPMGKLAAVANSVGRGFVSVVTSAAREVTNAVQGLWARLGSFNDAVARAIGVPPQAAKSLMVIVGTAIAAVVGGPAVAISAVVVLGIAAFFTAPEEEPSQSDAASEKKQAASVMLSLHINHFRIRARKIAKDGDVRPKAAFIASFFPHQAEYEKMLGKTRKLEMQPVDCPMVGDLQWFQDEAEPFPFQWHSLVGHPYLEYTNGSQEYRAEKRSQGYEKAREKYNLFETPEELYNKLDQSIPDMFDEDGRCSLLRDGGAHEEDSEERQELCSDGIDTYYDRDMFEPVPGQGPTEQGRNNFVNSYYLAQAMLCSAVTAQDANGPYGARTERFRKHKRNLITGMPRHFGFKTNWKEPPLGPSEEIEEYCDRHDDKQFYNRVKCKIVDLHARLDLLYQDVLDEKQPEIFVKEFTANPNLLAKELQKLEEESARASSARAILGPDLTSLKITFEGQVGLRMAGETNPCEPKNYFQFGAQARKSLQCEQSACGWTDLAGGMHYAGGINFDAPFIGEDGKIFLLGNVFDYSDFGQREHCELWAELQICGGFVEEFREYIEKAAEEGAGLFKEALGQAVDAAQVFLPFAAAVQKEGAVIGWWFKRLLQTLKALVEHFVKDLAKVPEVREALQRFIYPMTQTLTGFFKPVIESLTALRATVQEKVNQVIESALAEILPFKFKKPKHEPCLAFTFEAAEKGQNRNGTVQWAAMKFLMGSMDKLEIEGEVEVPSMPVGININAESNIAIEYDWCAVHPDKCPAAHHHH